MLRWRRKGGERRETGRKLIAVLDIKIKKIERDNWTIY
jgi:hypothetical protein